MKCPKCNEELKIQVATNAKCEGCKILTTIISIVTVQCDNCMHIFQTSVEGKRFFSVNKDDSIEAP